MLKYHEIEPDRADARLIRRIVRRAQRNHPAMVPDPLVLELDLRAAHVKGPGLRLRELLEAETFDFVHDIGGISLNIDRNSGTMLNHFSPRFAARLP